MKPTHHRLQTYSITSYLNNDSFLFHFSMNVSLKLILVGPAARLTTMGIQLAGPASCPTAIAAAETRQTCTIPSAVHSKVLGTN
mmetsp:Transcript_26402/g.55630  ORF Transcript_26402/g.55630 Transcript_26402/m.55630 type:complete len:84 (-) Transcript_26402:77-328(-)